MVLTDSETVETSAKTTRRGSNDGTLAKELIINNLFSEQQWISAGGHVIET